MPSADAIERVGIVGGGLMGAGIAEVCVRAGIESIVVEVAAAERTRSRIDASLKRASDAGKLTQEAASAAAKRVSITEELDDIQGCQAVIEAVSEDEVLKRQVFARLDELLPEPRFLATNTSSVPIMNLAAATSRPQLVIGLHFFNPAPVLPLVEVVRSIMTSADTLSRARGFVGQLEKETIDSQDRAGFVVNALLVPYLLSAIRMYESGFASKEDIDRGMVLGCAHPIGPLALADLIGLDTLIAVSESLYDEFREPGAVVPPLVSRMVEAGVLGRKTGRGFYSYA
jgi:3-hydroxybutyryl-CoA dehydrogenase